LKTQNDVVQRSTERSRGIIRGRSYSSKRERQLEHRNLSGAVDVGAVKVTAHSE
jgi:hypothetical protein